MQKLKITLIHLFLFTLILSIFMMVFSSREINIHKEQSLMNNANDLIKMMIEDENIPAVQITFFEDGVITDTHVFQRSSSDHEQIDKHSIFRAQSLTKTITATLVLKLVEEGKMGLDDTLLDHLSDDFLNQIPEEVHDLTVRSLLKHQSGLYEGDYTLMYGLDDQIPSLDEALIRDLQKPLVDQDFYYSNVGYNLLEKMIEEVSGLSYQHYADEVIFQKSNLVDTHFDYKRSQMEKYVKGSTMLGDTVEPYIYAEKASGGLLTTSEDYATYLIDLAKGSYLSTEMLQTMISANGSLNSYYDVVFDNYGMGVFIESHGNTLTLSHGGQGTGYMSYYHLIPDQVTGYVILTNSQRAYPLFSALTSLFNRYYDLPSPGIKAIEWIMVLSKVIQAVLIYLILLTLYALIQQKTYRSMIYHNASFVAAVFMLVISLMLRYQSNNFIHVLIPSDYERLMMLLFITSLVAMVYHLAAPLINLKKGGKQHATFTQRSTDFI